MMNEAVEMLERERTWWKSCEWRISKLEI